MRPKMRFVEVKSQAQSDMQAPHRARERLVSERTADGPFDGQVYDALVAVAAGPASLSKTITFETKTLALRI